MNIDESFSDEVSSSSKELFFLHSISVDLAVELESDVNLCMKKRRDGR